MKKHPVDVSIAKRRTKSLRDCLAANTALLNNFEIVATTLIALLFFREAVGRRLWAAIGLVTVANILLSLDGGSVGEAFHFS